MSEDQLQGFLSVVAADSSLQEKLNAATDPAAVVELARQAGFAITEADLERVQSELTDRELESAAGGLAGKPILGYTAWTVGGLTDTRAR